MKSLTELSKEVAASLRSTFLPVPKSPGAASKAYVPSDIRPHAVTADGTKEWWVPAQRLREDDGPAIECANGTKLFLRRDGYTVTGAGGILTELRGAATSKESVHSGNRLIEYSNGSSVTVSDGWITVKPGDGTSLNYSTTAAPLPGTKAVSQPKLARPR